MKLSKRAIKAINVPKVRNLLALALGCTDQTVTRYIKDNEPNGDLTKVVALEIIKRETKLSDSQLWHKERTVESVSK